MNRLSRVLTTILTGPGRDTSPSEELRDDARPMKILTIDIDESPPDLFPRTDHASAYVVALSRGVPRATAVLPLTSDPSTFSKEVQDFIGETSLREPSALDDPVVADGELPKISVVIPSAISRLPDLRVCLDSIGELDYPLFEAVLVDNRRQVPSPDPLDDVVRGRTWLRVVREARPGSSIARNTGAASIDADIVAFVDDDVRVDRQWLRAIGTRMTRDPSLEILTGLILPAELESPSQIWFERYFGGMGSERTFLPLSIEPAPEVHHIFRGRSVVVRDPQGQETRRISIYGIGGYGASANMAVRRTALDRVGGFDATLGAGTPAYGGEDLALLVDVLWSGGKIGYEPAAFVWHRHRQEYNELLEQAQGYAMGVTAMLTRMVIADPRHLLCIVSKLHVAARKKWSDARQLSHGTTTADHRNLPTTTFPPTLFRRELFGLMRGPFAYVRSRAWWRKESGG